VAIRGKSFLSDLRKSALIRRKSFLPDPGDVGDYARFRRSGALPALSDQCYQRLSAV